MTKKEAIETIKTTMPYMWKETKEAIQTLIPEFAESDDEKIRKELILFVNKYYGEETKKEVLAYLEKQKEQKPVNYDCEMRKNCEVNFEGGKREVVNNPEKYGLCKPSEWSEEDLDALEQAIIALEDMYDEDNPGTCYAGHHLPFKEAAQRLKSLRHQPHKWYIKKGHWYMCIVDKPEYGWTKGKVYQSPEDNRIETDYKGDLTNWPYYEPWFRPATMEEIPDFKPHWKPSEEQMKALEEAMDRNDKIGYILRTLYDDIKNDDIR